MSSSRIPSPARSQGVISTPRKHTPRRSRSVCSAKSNMSVRLTAVISDSFKLSPMPNRRSVLNDDTDIEMPGRKSWWKKLGENSRDVMEVLENEDIAEVNNVAEEFDVEILSQEKKNYSIDLPESSDGESISSIVIPQRKLFTQKDNQPQTKFGHIIDNRETLAKLQKSHFDQEKEINIAPKNLFNQASKPRTKPAFPAALLNISSKTVNKTKEMPTAEVKGQVRNLFGNRPGMKRKNMFADFIVSDSEDEILDIQPKVFGFQKNTGQKRRESSASRGIGHSPTSSIDLELEDWKLLPSSTMVDNQLEEAGAITPVKRARLSKLSEAKESETTNINSTVNKTKQSNKSVNSKNKSKNSSNSKLKENNLEDLNPAPKTKEDIVVSQNNQSLNSSTNIRLTRNKSKSMRESSFKEGDHSKLHNKSKITLQSKQSTPVKALFHERVKNSDQVVENNMETNLIQNEVEIQNISTGQVPGDDDEEDFTLEYENDEEPMNEINEPATSNNANNTKNKESNNQSSKIHEDASIKTLIEVHQVQYESNEDNDFVDAIIETVKGGKEAVDKTNDEIGKKQKDRDELGVNQHIEKGEQHNKSNQNLVKNSDKKENKSELEEEVPKQSQSAGKYQKQNLTNIQNNSRKSENVYMDDEIHQKTQNDSQIEEENNDKVDSEDFVENENANLQIEGKDHEQSGKNVMQNESEHTDDENVIQNESEHTDDENVIQNESEHTDDENVMQNESEQTDNENVMQNKSEQTSTREGEDEQNDSVDEALIDAEENEDSDQIHIDKQNESHETEDEAEDQTDQDESENINSDDQEQNDGNSNQNEIEEQQNEEIEIDEEENESEVDEQNETEDQDESENADSDDNLQNESNQEENVEQDEQIESDQEQSDNEIEDNQVPEDEVVANETSNDHDTTGRHRKKEVTNIKSPEAILHDKTNQIESFTAQGRNTSVRKTKSIIKNINIRPSLAPVRESTGMSDGTRDSSTEGSGWDSHRTTRKTIRLTLGKDFTPRKSLRALVMEKSAKRNTNYNEIMANTTKIPQANSTELPAFDSYQEPEPVHVDETVEEPSDHEVSARTRQTTLEMYLQKIKQENLERKRKMEEEIRASLKAPTRDTFNSFKVPLKPIKRVKPIQNKSKTKIKSSVIPLDMLPSEVLEDMKYKPPKRFQPSNASWITKRLYKFLESKLEPKYDYKARVRAERLVELLYSFTREARRGASEQAVDTLKKEMARLDVVKTHFDFYEFFHEFMPREIRVKVVPDVVNKISLPKNGVFSNIII